MRLSPLYDVVSTTPYIAADSLALKINKAKFWPSRQALIEFGKAHCRLDRPDEIIDRILEVVASYEPIIEAGEIWRRMQPEIEKGVGSIATTRATMRAKKES